MGSGACHTLGVRSGLVNRRGIPATISAVLTATILTVGLAVRSIAPFGERGRGINDLGDQFVPFHAHLWDLLRGQSPSSWQWTWESGLGVPFVPDLATYLGNPLALTVALWPRTQLESAVLVVTLLTYAVAAAAMVTYLRRIRPEGHPLIAALLGAAYATCGWALDDASYVPMWLAGLVGLPLLALVGEWARERVHPVAGPFVVALVWFANYYTAYMATIGAGLLVLGRVIAAGEPWRVAVGSLLRATRQVVLGVAMTAVTLLPAYLAVRGAQPTPTTESPFASTPALLARFLPLTEGVGLSPGLFVGTATLVLLLTLPWNAAVALRERLTWTVLAGLTLASLQTEPTRFVWHAFAAPNGSGYRQAYVVCGMAIVLAWISLTAGVRRWAAVAGALTAGGVVLVGRGVTGTTRGTVLVAASLVVLTLAWLLLRDGSRSNFPRMGRVIGLVLALAVVAESLASWVVLDAQRADRFSAVPAWGPANDRLLSALHGRTTALAGRSEVLPPVSANAPLLYGYQGVRYYSSTIPATTSRALVGLGVRWSGGGRVLSTQRDPGLDPLLGMGEVFTSQGYPAADGGSARGAGAAGRVIDGSAPAWSSTPWAAREALAGSSIYTTPSVEVHIDGKVRPLTESGMRQRVLPGTRVGLDVSCPDGWTAQFWAPEQGGRLLSADGSTDLSTSAPGPVGSRVGAGVVTIRLRDGSGPALELDPGPLLALPASPIGCLDADALNRVIHEGNGAVTTGKNSVKVTWSTPRTGSAVLPMTAVDGWACVGADGRPRALGTVSGLRTAQIHADRELTCSYRTPGLTLGAAATAIAALLALAWGLWDRRRVASSVARARDPEPDSAAAPPTTRA